MRRALQGRLNCLMTARWVERALSQKERLVYFCICAAAWELPNWNKMRRGLNLRDVAQNNKSRRCFCVITLKAAAQKTRQQLGEWLDDNLTHRMLRAGSGWKRVFTRLAHHINYLRRSAALLCNFQQQKKLQARTWLKSSCLKSIFKKNLSHFEAS
jgi:hypothetical protein